MGSPYVSTTVSGYNANPPSDDGAVTEANRGKWSTIKTKIGDPLNVFAAAVNTNLIAAFGRIMGGAGISSTAVSYSVVAGDQGKIIRASTAAITITTPSALVVGTPFMFTVLNDSSGDITVDGFGTQTIDGDLTVTMPANTGMTLNTDGSNWFSAGQNFQRTQVPPQGYLTLVSIASAPLTPIPAADVLASTSVFYRPYRGNLIPISNGTTFAIREFSELTLTLAAQHVANSIYDVFAFNDAGVIRIGTGPAWSNVTAGSCTRGSGAGTTELSRLNGLLVNTVALTARNGATTYSVAAANGTYLGSIHIDGSAGQATCHVTYGQSRKWAVWNAFNRMPIVLLAGDSTATWTPTNGIASINANAANTARPFCGLAEEWVASVYTQYGETGTATGTADIFNGIGLNSTSAYSGKNGSHYINHNDAAATINSRGDLVARFQMTPRIGINNLNMLDNGSGTARVNRGGNANCVMEVTWMG
jgi:aspartate 1-decarboxylase